MGQFDAGSTQGYTRPSVSELKTVFENKAIESKKVLKIQTRKLIH